jgi:endonuclease YncB( thermonuclease family)
LAIGVLAAIAMAILFSSPVAVRGKATANGSGTLEIMGPVRVIDGDTLELYIDGHQTAVGIIGIKAPRGNSPCGQQATQLTQQLVSLVDGREAPVQLRFEADPVVTFDTRHRRMYRLTLPDGSSVAQRLVAAGLADPDGTGEETVALDLAKRLALKCGD